MRLYWKPLEAADRYNFYAAYRVALTHSEEDCKPRRGEILETCSDIPANLPAETWIVEVKSADFVTSAMIQCSEMPTISKAEVPSSLAP